MLQFTDPIVAGTVLVRPAVRSPNYVAGVSGWTVNIDGSAEFNNGTFRGTVTAAVFDGTNWEANADGTFFYSPSPGPGNLIISNTSAAGVDRFGNSFGAGLNVGNQSGDHLGIDTLGRIFLFNPSDQQIFELSGHNGQIAAKDTSGNIQAVFAGGAAPFGLVGPAVALVGGNPETWHNVAPPAGWAGTLRYKMLSETNRVFLDYALTHTALAAQTTVALFTLPNSPANYRPVTSATLDCTPSNNTANGTPAPSTFVGSGGAVSAFNVPVGTTGIDCHESYPLD